MPDWTTPRLTLLFVTALSLIMVLAPDGFACGSPADSELLLEEVKKDAESDETIDCDGLAHIGDSIVPAAAAFPLHGTNCGVLLTPPQCRWRTRGPPSATILSTL